MNFIKKLGNLISKMTSSRKNEKLVEALNQKPKSKEYPVQDIEDLLKTQYSSPLQTRSQRLKRTEANAVSSLAASAQGSIRLKPIPLPTSETVIGTKSNLNVKLNTNDKQIVGKVKPLGGPVPEIETNQTQGLSLETIPSKASMLTEISHPRREIEKKTTQLFESNHEDGVQITIAPSSSEVESAKVKKQLKAAGKAEKSKRVPKLSHVEETNPKAKPKRKSKDKTEGITTEEPIAKKRSPKKSAKEKQELEIKQEEQLSAADNLSEGGEPPTPSKSVKPSNKVLKLSPFQFSPNKITKNDEAPKIDDTVVGVKPESKRKRASPLKSKESCDPEPEIKLEKWQPEQWALALENIKQMRTSQEAPVDQMGCHKCCDENADEKTKRFQHLVALMLSSQTRDQITYEVMHRLRDNTCTPASIAQMDPEKLMEIIHPVSFYKNKTKYLQNTSKILVEKYDSDIPKNVTEMIKLPGVGPKMAHICMSVAWDTVTGIGVDTHVHRIANRLGWVKDTTKDPEKTRKQLELWLPSEHWKEVNYLMVGFGQTLCTPIRPKCDQCLNSAFCPSANVVSSPQKREVKKEKQKEP